MAAAALVIGAGISAYSSMKAADDKAAAYRADALNKQAQAAQVEIATNRDVALFQQHADRVKSAQISAIGRSGTQISGSNLRQLEQTAADTVSQIAALRQAGGYHNRSILTEGLYDEMLSDQATSAGNTAAIGSLFGAVSKNPYSYDQPVKGGVA